MFGGSCAAFSRRDVIGLPASAPAHPCAMRLRKDAAPRVVGWSGFQKSRVRHPPDSRGDVIGLSASAPAHPCAMKLRKDAAPGVVGMVRVSRI